MWGLKPDPLTTAGASHPLTGKPRRGKKFQMDLPQLIKNVFIVFNVGYIGENTN